MGPPGVEVRGAVADDVPAVVAVFHRARAAAMPWLPVLHTPEEDLAFFAHAVGGEGHRAWVAVRGGAVVGFLAGEPGWVGHLYVDPDEQGRGTGSALLAAAQQAWPEGFDLWVFARNRRAQEFYERRGLVPVYATDGGGNEERLPDVRYRWRP